MKKDAGSLVMRAVVGIIFFMHGLAKFQGGISGTAGWFESMGIPGFAAYATAVIELIGGLLLLIGLGTRITAALLAVIMIGAIVTVKWEAGLMGSDGAAGYELDLALFAIAFYFVWNGSSTLSVDQMIRNRKAE
ncbi:DoxX family protein [Halobacillus litoralis]|uniref:DoxX family protein n=1 Tax=Halobacillus litoralis TaxID=45668 RepID=UPI001CD801C3|nr:DoxX family protein [Halobacillus litoralis]MCA1022022.1 DoxX family protein [Halobacillus litoralis]